MTVNLYKGDNVNRLHSKVIDTIPYIFKKSINKNIYIYIYMKQYICVAWKSNKEDHAFSRVQENESLENFKERMNYVFPLEEGWHLEYSEWNKI